MRNWRGIRIFLLIAGVQFGSISFANDSRHLAAVNLIHAMRADEQAAQLVERYVRDACRDSECKVDLTKCVAAIDREGITDRLVRLANRELTPSEIEAGTTYFRSEIGIRHLEVLRATRGLGKATLNDQKPEVRTAMLAFLDTSAGYRLVTRSLLTNSTEVNQMMNRERRRVFLECRPVE